MSYLHKGSLFVLISKCSVFFISIDAEVEIAMDTDILHRSGLSSVEACSTETEKQPNHSWGNS